jgi:hypothetical protein
VWSGTGAHVVRLEWRPTGTGADLERFQTMRIQDDKIIEIAGYPTLKAAMKTAKRFAAQAAG